MTLRQSKSDTNTSQQQTQRQGIDKYTSQRPIQTNHSDRVHQIQIRHVDRVQIQKHVAITYTCLFVCLEFLVPLENFSLIWRRHHCRAVNFDLCSPLMAIEQWGFFSMPHLLWHGASVTRDTPPPLMPPFGSGAVTTCFNDLGLSRLGFEHPTFRLQVERFNPLRHRRGPLVCNNSNVVFCFASLSRKFYLFRNVTFVGEWLQNIGLRSMHTVFG